MTIKRTITLEAANEEQLDRGLRLAQSLIHNGETDYAIATTSARCNVELSTEYGEDTPRPVEVFSESESMIEWLATFRTKQEKENRQILARMLQDAIDLLENDDFQAAWKVLYNVRSYLQRLRYKTASQELEAKLSEWFPVEMEAEGEAKERAQRFKPNEALDPVKDLESIRYQLVDAMPDVSQHIKRGVVEYNQDMHAEAKQTLIHAYNQCKARAGEGEYDEVLHFFRRAMRGMFPEEKGGLFT